MAWPNNNFIIEATSVNNICSNEWTDGVGYSSWRQSNDMNVVVNPFSSFSNSIHCLSLKWIDQTVVVDSSTLKECFLAMNRKQWIETLIPVAVDGNCEAIGSTETTKSSVVVAAAFNADELPRRPLPSGGIRSRMNMFVFVSNRNLSNW